MKFNRMGKWYEQSDCGGYTVCAAKVGDEVIYSAFRVRYKQGALHLHTCKDAQVCRQACLDHAANSASALSGPPGPPTYGEAL